MKDEYPDNIDLITLITINEVNKELANKAKQNIEALQ